MEQQLKLHIDTLQSKMEDQEKEAKEMKKVIDVYIVWNIDII